MKQLVGDSADDPRLAPIRALRRIIPMSDDLAAIDAALLAEIDAKTKGGSKDA